MWSGVDVLFGCDPESPKECPGARAREGVVEVALSPHLLEGGDGMIDSVFETCRNHKAVDGTDATAENS